MILLIHQASPLLYNPNIMSDCKKITSIINRFLFRQGIMVNCLSLYRRFRQHPLLHSVRSISDVLDSFGIQNMVCRISIEQLDAVPVPSIVFIEKKAFPYYIYMGTDNAHHIILESFDRKRLELNIDEFAQNWNGVALMTDNEDAKSDNVLEYLIKQLLWRIDSNLVPVILSLYVLITNILYLNSDSVNNYILLVLSLLGLSVSVAAIMKSYSKNRFLQKVCDMNKTGDGCKLIAEDSGASFFEWISLGELAFAYFGAFSIIASIMDMGSLLIILTSLSMLVVLYSFIWQIYKKALCWLCAAIDVLLIGMFVISIMNIEWLNISIKSIFLEFILFSLGFSLYIFLAKAITTLLRQSRDISQNYNRVEKILSDDKLLSALLMNSNRIFSDSDIDQYCPIEYHQFEYKYHYRLTIIVSPECKWCSSLYDTLERISDCRIDLFIACNIANPQSKDKAFKNIQARFKDANYERLEQILLLHNEFCLKYEINHTPSIFIDGKPLPDIYVSSDIEYII